jgi:ribonuclease D
MTLSVEYIEETDALASICKEARTDGLYGLDTEFVRDRTYFPHLALIQIATNNRIALIDPLADLSLEPLFELLHAEDACPILHAAAQDLEILWLLSGKLPTQLFDTQLAAAFVGLGQQTSYGALVKSVTGLALDKGEQFTDWMRRPLEQSQLAYAADDVRYLRALHDHLRSELESRGRLDVVLEEQALQLDPNRFELDEAALLKKVKGARGLPPREQGVARSLAVWRERQAQDRDIPRKWVISDDTLVAIARQKPQQERDLRRIRGLHPNEARRSSSAIIDAVEAGLQSPIEQSSKQKKTRLPPEAEIAVDFLKPLLKTLCRQEGIAPATVGTSALVEELARGHFEGTLDSEPPALLRGWRGLLVGAPLRQFLNGQLSIRLNPGESTPLLERYD